MTYYTLRKKGGFMSKKTGQVRSSEEIKRGLLKRAFEGRSQFTPEEMIEEIAERERRVKDGPSEQEILTNLYGPLCGDKGVPSLKEMETAMGDSESRALRAFNLVSFLSGRDESGQYTILKEAKTTRTEDKVGNDNNNKSVRLAKALQKRNIN